MSNTMAQQPISTCPGFTIPPLDRSLTLPEIYGWHAVHSPKHPLFVFEESQGKLRKILWEEMAHGIDQAARLCAASVEGEGSDDDAKVITVLGSMDSITFTCLAVGIMRAGHTFFPISPRNSAAAAAHLLVQSGSHHVFVTPDHAMQCLIESAKSFVEEPFEVNVHRTPTFESLFPVDANEMQETPFVPRKRGLEDVAAIFHSSGTTSFPKPIPYTHRAFVDYGTMPLCSEVDLFGKVIGVHAVPLFHAMASIQMTFSAAVGLTLAVFKPHSPPVFPTSDNTLEGIVACRCDYTLVTPMFIELWVRNPEAVSSLAKLDGILHGGGPLAKEAAELMVSKGAKLISVYATTETIFISHFIPKDIGYDANYFKFSSNRDVRVIDIGNDDYTIALMCSERYRPNVTNITIDGVDGYHTNDIVKKHPTRDGFWTVAGRVDDQIMHSSGEKTNPGPLEKIFLGDPHISGAVIFGQGRFNCGVLVCPTERYIFDPKDETKLAEYRSLIWPTVEKSNTFAPSHSRIFKEMIIVTSPNKPLTYTGKGTIRRQASINEYEEEISAAYDAVQESSQEDISAPDDWSFTDALSFVREVVGRTLKVEIQNVADTDDLFEVGLDSLQATWIRNTIFHALRQDYPAEVRQLSQNMVYEHSSVASLARYLSHSVTGTGHVTQRTTEQGRHQLLALVEQYTQNVTAFKGDLTADKDTSYEKTVILTGGTGSLGANILYRLLESTDVAKVYAFSRATSNMSTASDRHVHAFEKEGLPVNVLLSSRVEFFDADPSLESFGLPAPMFEKLQEEVTHIIHNGWRVNFNVSVSSFESNIRGVRSFVDFSLCSRRAAPPRILFISSIGVVQNWTNEGPVPEIPLPEPDTAIGVGYSESKWVSERILTNLVGSHSTIVRCGQITGGPRGAWNTHEWFPSLVKTSIALKMFPRVEGNVSWVSASDAAGALVDVLDAKDAVLHFVHPSPVSWNDVAALFSKALKVPLVPYEEWLRSLQSKVESASSDNDEQVLTAIPAVHLMDFFLSAKDQASNSDREPLGIPRLGSEYAQERSHSLRSAKPVGLADVERWLDAWRKSGFIPSPSCIKTIRIFLGIDA